MMIGRSFKYHRPRGVVAAGAEEPNALVNLGRGGAVRAQPAGHHDRAFRRPAAPPARTTGRASNSTSARSTPISARFLPAGFYYKMFMYPRAVWKHVYEPFIRQSAGLGKAPKDARCRHLRAFPRLCRCAGRSAAALPGCRRRWRPASPGRGCSCWSRRRIGAAARRWMRPTIDGKPAADWVKNAVQDLEKMPNVTIRTRTMGAGVYDHGYALGYERLTDHSPRTSGPRHRLWRIRARQIVTATGAIERPLSFAGNDLPGVMLASAVRDYAGQLGRLGRATGRWWSPTTTTPTAPRWPCARPVWWCLPSSTRGRRRPARCPQQARAARHPGADRHAALPRSRAARRVTGGRRLRAGRRGRGAGRDRLRLRGDVGRLVAGGASVVALRRQADLGRRSGDVPPRCRARRRPGLTARPSSSPPAPPTGICAPPRCSPTRPRPDAPPRAPSAAGSGRQGRCGDGRGRGRRWRRSG